ncbi:MAG TPA: hypothetical protein PLX02_05665 [Syntrophorhabdaceae bacterium]|nr:hypothetical protein [Syntrophorhabdaceae bacterium]HQM81092.1 hypothetical protein [Syntrophorhabdaceae bacterium]
MKTKIIILCLAILLHSCAMAPKRTASIVWPDRIVYMAALCELDMSWKGMDYSGAMSLQVDYPHVLLVEVYGPFGNTVMYIKKDRNGFLLENQEVKDTDEGKFEKEFGIQLSDFIEDITMSGIGKPADKGPSVVQRKGYTVTYRLDNESTLCWHGAEGHICIEFLEVSFEKGRGLEKGTSAGM